MDAIDPQRSQYPVCPLYEAAERGPAHTVRHPALESHYCLMSASPTQLIHTNVGVFSCSGLVDVERVLRLAARCGLPLPVDGSVALPAFLVFIIELIQPPGAPGPMTVLAHMGLTGVSSVLFAVGLLRMP